MRHSGLKDKKKRLYESHAWSHICTYFCCTQHESVYSPGLMRYRTELQRRFHRALLDQNLTVEEVARHPEIQLAPGSLRNIVNGAKVSDATRQKLTTVLREVLWDDVPVEVILRYGDLEFLLPTVEAAVALENQCSPGSVIRDGRVIQIAPGALFRLRLVMKTLRKIKSEDSGLADRRKIT